MGLLLDLAIAAPVIGAAAGVVLPERAVDAMRGAGLLAAAFWFALLVDGSLVSGSHLHSTPLVAAAGCGAALLVATVDEAALARPAWSGISLAAVSVALASGHRATDGGGAVVALAIAAAAASLAAGPSPRVLAPGAIGVAVAAIGVVALRSAANSWQLPIADAASSHRAAGLAIVAGAALLVLAGAHQARVPAAVLVPAAAFLGVQAAPIVHRADGLAWAAITLAVVAAGAAVAGGAPRRVLHHPTAALTILAFAVLIGPGDTRGPGLLLAAAGTLALALEWSASAALAVPGGVALAIALAARGGATPFVLGVLTAVVALVLAAHAARETAVRRPTMWSAPVLALGVWLVLAPGTWGWVGPVSLRPYDVGAARALAGAAIYILMLVLLGLEPGGWYARALPPDSPGEDVVRH